LWVSRLGQAEPTWSLDEIIVIDADSKMTDKPINLLLIEDNADLAVLIGEMLAGATNPSFCLKSVDRLAEGIRLLAAGDIDLVVLDLSLPDSTGVDSLNQIRGESPGAPVVVLTALEDKAVALRSLREGAQDYLLKGEITQSSLVRSIQYALERARGAEIRSRLAAIVESSHDAIIGMSLEGLIVSWNPGAERIFGYGFEEVIGRSIAMLAVASSPDEIPAMLAEIIGGDYVKDFETVQLKKGNLPIHVGVSLSPIRDALGATIGASLIARDIDHRKQAEAERERLIQELQTALANIRLLKGLLPICAWCKKIKDDAGYWQQVEHFIQSYNTQLDFTHGLCPECSTKYLSQLPEH